MGSWILCSDLADTNLHPSAVTVHVTTVALSTRVSVVFIIAIQEGVQ